MYDSMHFDEHELRLEARRRIAAGQLPCDPHHSMWAGTGEGLPCSICDRPIGENQIEYELQFDGEIRPIYRFHRICHQAWELECIRR